MAKGDRTPGRRSHGIVQTVAVVEQPTLMYNLTVAEAHTFFVGDGEWLVHNTCPVRGRGETSYTIRGRQAHRNYELTLGGGYRFNRALPSGKRADALNWSKRIVRKLKPDNPRAVARGWNQVLRYKKDLETLTGKKWKAYVDVYRR